MRTGFSESMQGVGVRLTSELGRGASSVVYRAERDDRAYALKVLQDARPSTQKEWALRFRREGAALARLSHPGLVQVFEVGEQEGTPYLLMELVEGVSLARRLEGGPLEEAQLLRVGAVLAGALDLVHRRGLVHRDVKPANILLSAGGAVKLIDFGFVATAAGGSRDEVAGTFLYAAPEQSGMLKRAVDGRSDLYALGATLFECATGRPPFVAESATELMRLHAAVPAPDARALNPSLRPALAAIIAKLLAKDPDERYQTGAGVVADLDALGELDGLARRGEPLRLGRRDVSVARGTDGPLVGRAPELRALEDAWGRALTGRSELKVVVGEAGTGKTRLVSELRRKVGREVVFWGRCERSDQILLGPLREALESWAEQVNELPESERKARIEQVRDALDGAGWDTVAITPALGKLVGKPARAVKSGREDQNRLFESLAGFLAELGSRLGGVLLVLEDLQWLDAGTARVLERLKGLPSGTPLLVVGTASGTRDRPPQSLGEVVPAEAWLPLGALEPEQLGELLTHHLGGGRLDKGLVRFVTARSHGNPFIAHEYLARMLESGVLRPTRDGWTAEEAPMRALSLPTDVLQLVIDRVGRLTQTAQELLRYAAAAGETLEPKLLQGVMGAGAEDVDQAVIDAVQAGLVERTGSGALLFEHPRVREALLSRVEAQVLRGIHQRLAEALDGRGEQQPAQVQVVARHYARGEPLARPQRTFLTNLEAGVSSVRARAYAEGLAFLEVAQEVSGAAGECATERRPILEEALGRAKHGVGRVAEALEHLQWLLDHTAEPAARARVHADLARCHLFLMQLERGWDHCLLALEQCGAGWPRTRLTGLLTTLWSFLATWVLERLGLRYGSARGADLERRRFLIDVYTTGYVISYFSSRFGRVFQLMSRILHHAHHLGTHPDVVEPTVKFAMLLSSLQLRRTSLGYFRRAREVAAKMGDKWLMALYVRLDAAAANMRGEVADGERQGRECLEQWGGWLSAYDHALAAIDLAHNLLLQGRAREAEEIFARGRKVVDGTVLPSGQMIMRAGQVACFALSGEVGRAVAVEGEARKVAADARVDDVVLWMYLLTAGMLLRLEQDELGAPLEELISHFEKIHPNPRFVAHQFKLGFVMVARARLAQLERATAEGREEAHRKAVAALRKLRQTSKVPSYQAHLQVLEATLARLDKKTWAARRRLKRAERLAGAAGSAWAQFEVQREQARLAPDGQSRKRHADAALQLARAQGWRGRVRAVRREFGVEEAAPRPESSHGGTLPSPASSVNGSTSHALAGGGMSRFLDALFKVALASSANLDPVQQGRVVLDEIVKVFGAQRGFLFLIDPEGNPKWVAGRDAGGVDISSATGFASTVVQQVVERRRPVVVSGTDEGTLLGSTSALSNDLRSIMAAPLLLQEQFVGVVYLDTKLIRGLFTEDDLDALQALASHIAVAVVGARATRLEVEKKELQKELELSAMVQVLLLPQEQRWESPALKLAGLYRPADRCGGDWWWYQPLGPERLRIVMADVTGHGAGPAMVTAIVASTFRLLSENEEAQDVRRLLERLDAEVTKMCRGAYDTTVGIAELSVSEGRLRYWSAGAPPILRIGADRQVKGLVAAGSPLGRARARFGYAEEELRPGDRVVLFTDGLVEQETRAGRPFGVRRLSVAAKESLEQAPAVAIEGILAEVDLHRGEVAQGDDFTLAIVGVSPEGVPAAS